MSARITMDVHFDLSKCPWLKNEDFVRKLIAVEFQKFIRLALARGKPIAQALTPVGATGNLRGSVITEIARGKQLRHEGAVRWRKRYAGIVARRGPARLVPLPALEAWASAVLGDASLAVPIQLKITKRGTPSPAHPNPGTDMDIKLEQQWTPVVCTLFEVTCRIIAGRLNGRI